MKDAIIRARCSEDLKTRIKNYAKLYELDEADIVRQAVEMYLQQVESEGSITMRPKEKGTISPAKKPSN